MGMYNLVPKKKAKAVKQAEKAGLLIYLLTDTNVDWGFG